MKVVMARRSLRRILRWTRIGLMACAVSMLAYCVFAMADARSFQRRQRQELERLLARQPDEEHRGSSVTARKEPIPVAMDGLIGRIDIPRLDLSVIVIEGTDSTTLRRAVGHIPGTALPGEPGNAGISGHRDTFFRPLRNVRRGDLITLTTPRGEYRYRVVSTEIVNPRDVSVLAAGGREVLTLVTCYPFYYIGPAPERFIVRAERMT